MMVDFAVGAAVIRDHLGKFVGAGVQKYQVDNSLEGEVCAAQLGIEVAKRKGFSDVIVEGDSLLTIDALWKYPSRVDWSIHSRIADIVFSASGFNSCVFSFVTRGANEVAHHLLVGLTPDWF